MAIDTAAKRLDALNFGSVQPSLGLPFQSGTLDQFGAIGLYELGEEVAGAPTDLAAAAGAGGSVDLTWTDIATGNTDYSIERADLTAGDAFAEIATTGDGGAESYNDVGPFTAGHRYAYRVKVVGGLSDGEYSNQVAVFGGSSALSRRRRQRY
jgi:hypothetical protein